MVCSKLSIFQIEFPGECNGTMKLKIQHRLHQPSPAFTTLLEEEFAALSAHLRIDEARVLIERQPDASPPFRMSAHLVTPGPDVFAEASDHTLRAALHKLISSIGDKITQRSQRRSRKILSRHSGRTLPQPPSA